jgi:hypothetical protein
MGVGWIGLRHRGPKTRQALRAMAAFLPNVAAVNGWAEQKLGKKARVGQRHAVCP